MENQAKVSSYKVPYEDYRKWQAVCPENEYRVVTASELPTGTPATLKQKSVQVVVMSSGDDANNRSVVVANFIRHDRHKNRYRFSQGHISINQSSWESKIGNLSPREPVLEIYDAMAEQEEKIVYLNASYREQEGGKVTWLEYWDAGPGVPEHLFVNS